MQNVNPVGVSDASTDESYLAPGTGKIAPISEEEVGGHNYVSESNTPEALYVGMRHAINSALIGLPSLAEKAVSTPDFLKAESERNERHKTSATIGDIVGSFGPILAPEEGMLAGLGKVLAAPELAANFVKTGITGSEVAKSILNPTFLKAAGRAGEAMTYGAIYSTVDAMDDANLNGYSLDSGKAYLGSLWKTLGASAILGPAFGAIGDKLFPSAEQGLVNADNLIPANKMDPEARAGLNDVFDAAAHPDFNPNATPEGLARVKGNKEAINGIIDNLETLASRKNGHLDPTFERDNMLLDLFLTNEDFGSRLVDTGNKGFDLKYILKNAEEHRGIKQKLSEELNIPEEELNPREELLDRIYNHAHDVAGKTEAEAFPLIEDTMKISQLTDHINNSGTNLYKQRQALQSTIDELQEHIEMNSDPFYEREKLIASGQIVPKSVMDLLPLETRQGVQSSIDRKVLGPDPAKFKEFADSLRSALANVDTKARPLKEDFGGIYGRTIQMTQDINRAYNDLKNVYGKESLIPQEMKNLYEVVHGKAKELAGRSDIFGDSAKARSDLFYARHKKLTTLDDFKNIINQNKKSKIFSSLTYDDNGYVVPTNKSQKGFSGRSFSKIKNIGMGNGNMEIRKNAMPYLKGYIQNFEKELELAHRTANENIDKINHSLLTAKGAEKQKLQSMLEKSMKHAEDTNALIHRTKMNRASIDNRSHMLETWNNKRVAAWNDSIEAFSKFKQSKEKEVDFKVHGAPNLGLETIRLFRDAAVGYTAGVFKAGSWFALAGLASAAKKARNVMEESYNPVEAFYNSKTQFLDKQRNIQRASRQAITKNIRNERLGLNKKSIAKEVLTNIKPTRRIVSGIASATSGE